jgi:cytochrome c nitrite reductase small subunit
VFWVSIALAALGVILLLVVTRSRALRDAPGWRLLAFVAFFAVPVLFVVSSLQANLHHMKTVEFCGSCHVMERYVGSLTYDDDEPLSSVHYRNNYVRQETACYSCHVSYAMFGGVKAKVNGIHHVIANVRGEGRDKIELYEPYSNANCLHCHQTSQRFLEVEDHQAEENFLAGVQSGALSCLQSGCHDEGHYWDGKYDDAASDDESWDTPDSTAANQDDSTGVTE